MFRLMQNETIQRNIYLIQKQLEEFGVLNVAEAKDIVSDIVSDIARNSDNEARRLEAAKLALQWEGALTDPVKRYELDVRMQQHHIQTYEFKGPESNSLKSRKQDEQDIIDITPESDPIPESDIDIDSIL